MNLSTPFLLLIALLLTGCGTFNTVVRGDQVTAKNLREWRTYCASLPRIYSGAVYNFCLLNGEPNYSTDAPGSPGGIPFAVVDIALSGVLDTLALPYTIYRQVEDGNIELHR